VFFVGRVCCWPSLLLAEFGVGQVCCCWPGCCCWSRLLLLVEVVKTARMSSINFLLDNNPDNNTKKKIPSFGFIHFCGFAVVKNRSHVPNKLSSRRRQQKKNLSNKLSSRQQEKKMFPTNFLLNKKNLSNKLSSRPTKNLSNKLSLDNKKIFPTNNFLLLDNPDNKKKKNKFPSFQVS